MCIRDRLVDVVSFLSCPAIIFNNIAASCTSFVIGPIWSSDDANATNPYLDTNPYVGFNPTTPQKLAGSLIEPPVSLPNAHGTIDVYKRQALKFETLLLLLFLALH